METFVGDTVKINLDCNIDISSYASWFIKFKKPSGVTGWWSAAVDPSDNNQMTYTTLATDLDEPGEWALESHVEAAGVALHGKPVVIQVYEPLPETTTPPTTAAP